MTLADAIHKELEDHGRVSYPRRKELAEQYKVKPSIVRDEVHGAMRERMDEMPGGAGTKEWHRMRIMAELDAAKKLARERKTEDGMPDPDVATLVRAIIADAQVNGLMAGGKAAKKDDAPNTPALDKMQLADKRRVLAEAREYIAALEAQITKESANGTAH